MWTPLLASISSLGRPIGAPRVFLLEILVGDVCYPPVRFVILLYGVHNGYVDMHKCVNEFVYVVWE